MPDKDLSRKLQPKKDGPCPVSRECGQTVEVDFDKIRNVIFIDMVTLPKKGEEAASLDTPASSTSLGEG